MALQRLADCTAALRIPLPHRSIHPGAHDPAAIGAVGRRVHPALVALQRFTDCTAARCLPLSHRSIITDPHDPAAIAAKGSQNHDFLVTRQRFATAPRVVRSHSDGKSG